MYGAGRVLSGVEGHGPGPRMHVHLDVRPLTVPFDATTGFWLDGSRVVLAPPPPRAPVSALPPLPVQGRTRAEEEEEEEVEEDAGIDEAVPNRGRGRFRHAPLGGNGDNVEARWNVDAATTSGTTVDIVVYLHGYGAAAADFLARKAQSAGVDLVDSTRCGAGARVASDACARATRTQYQRQSLGVRCVAGCRRVQRARGCRIGVVEHQCAAVARGIDTHARPADADRALGWRRGDERAARQRSRS